MLSFFICGNKLVNNYVRGYLMLVEVYLGVDIFFVEGLVIVIR